MEKCKYCNNKFINKHTLVQHQNNAKYCLKIQGKINSEFKCTHCKKTYSTQQNLDVHSIRCSKKSIEILRHKYESQLSELNIQLSKKDIQIQQLQDKLENIAIKAVQRPFEDETTIEIEENLTENKDSDDDEQQEEYKLTPLEVGQGFTIEHREEDGYINVTNLCKAGGKLYKNWKKTQKTKDFLQVLSTSVPNGTDLLIKTESGGLNENRGTWVHPQVAINIAQWISPQFDVKVSGWVYEIMMAGKVDITNTTSFIQLQQENKDKQIKIQYLTKKYVKAQPRVQYEERNVVYILTTRLMKKDRRYILGKATNLTSRLSVYNKSDEHQVVYYQECGDEETMSMVENTVFHQLKNYREQANRERFLLPEKEEIELFSNIIKKSIEFFNK
jgi:hypothetical protein